MELYEFTVRVQQLLADLSAGSRLLTTQIVIPRERGQSADAVKWTMSEFARDVYVSVAESSGRHAWIVTLEGSFDALVACMYTALTNHEKSMKTNRFG